MDRRRFLTLPLGLFFVRVGGVEAETAVRNTPYVADAEVLYGALAFQVAGTIREAVDAVEGRYEITARGDGRGIANGLEAQGVMRDGRWAPLAASTWFDVAGRRSETRIRYDWSRRRVEYHYRGETFFLRRRRVADDVVEIPDRAHVDDAFSAILNFAEERWPAEGDGTLRTLVVRRRRPEGEGPDDVAGVYRAELVPFVLKVEEDRETRRPAASFDLTRFSSWARDGQPARIEFDAGRRPVSIAASLILGSSLRIQLRTA